MDIFLNILLLAVGFALLIKGADFFVDGASGIADKLKIPQIVIGLTIVAFGTSAPEAAISISAALKGSTGIAIGNILGSNALNVLLILGLTACICPLTLKKNTSRIEIPFMIGISVLVVCWGAFFKELSLWSGILMWAIFIGFFVYLIKMSKNERHLQASEEEKPAQAGKKPMKTWQLVLISILGLVAIVVGSNLTVDSASYIARAFNVEERIIGLTIVAFGTSLPELVTSVTAALKKKTDIAIGNIVGSNIFNILFVLGTTSLISSIPYDPKFIVDGIVGIAAGVLLYLFVIRKNRLSRPAGGIMLAGYAAYFAYLMIF